MPLETCSLHCSVTVVYINMPDYSICASNPTMDGCMFSTEATVPLWRTVLGTPWLQCLRGLSLLWFYPKMSISLWWCWRQ